MVYDTTPAIRPLGRSKFNYWNARSVQNVPRFYFWQLRKLNYMLFKDIFFKILDCRRYTVIPAISKVFWNWFKVKVLSFYLPCLLHFPLHHEIVSFKRRSESRKEKKSHGTKSGEWGGRGTMSYFFYQFLESTELNVLTYRAGATFCETLCTTYLLI